MDFFYTFFVNNSYFIILLRHACVYAVLMMTTLYFIAFWKEYCKNNKKNMNTNVICIHIFVFTLCVILLFGFFLHTFYEDLTMVSNFHMHHKHSHHKHSHKNHKKLHKEHGQLSITTEDLVRYITFVQIITENALVMEIAHILFNIFPLCCGN